MISLAFLLKVQRSEADYGIPEFACTTERVEVIECSAYEYSYYDRWISKQSAKLPSSTSLVRMFSPLVWLLTFLAIIFFIIFILGSVKYMKSCGKDIQLEDYEDFLVPFR